jgi:hypothetical protein
MTRIFRHSCIEDFVELECNERDDEPDCPHRASHLTTLDRELERLIRQTPEGMMFWSGSCAQRGATCGGCKHFGYEVPELFDDWGNVLSARKYPARCALYRKYTGRHGKPLNPETAACKYFEAKQDDETNLVRFPAQVREATQSRRQTENENEDE